MTRLAYWSTPLALPLLLALGCGPRLPPPRCHDPTDPMENEVVRCSDPDEPRKLGMTPLMVAAGLGDSDEVSLLLKRGADVHRIGSRMGASALHKAAQGNNTEIVRLLLDAGAFIDLQAPTHGHTALMDAVWHRRPVMVELLLSRGANADIVASDGSTARFWAERAGLEDIVTILDRFAARKREAIAGLELLAAAKEGDATRVKELLAAGADVDQAEPDRGYTPLHWAALRGHTEVVRALVGAGASPGKVGALMQATVAHKAAYMGHAPVLELVVKHVALDAQGPYNGYTALHDAVWHGHLEAAKVLIAAGARLDLRGHDGATPLDLARRYRYQAIVALIEEAQAKGK